MWWGGGCQLFGGEPRTTLDVDMVALAETAIGPLVEALGPEFHVDPEVSDRPWRDVLGILLTQAGAIDSEYLASAAQVLGVSDLLERALRAVGIRD